MTPLKPIEVFHDSFRIAELMLQLYRLLENDGLQTEGHLVSQVRSVLGAAEGEQLQLLLNPVFLGCIREQAGVPTATMRAPSLANLLRQAVISACTAYETYLSAALKEHIFVVIEVRQNDFFPTEPEAAKYFEGLTLSIGECFRLLNQQESPTLLGTKLLTFVQSKNLGSVAGMKTVGLLLGLDEPWNRVAEKLDRDVKDVRKVVAGCIERRNSIVHKGDRNIAEGSPEKQAIAYAWTRQAVDTIGHACLAFDELVNAKIAEFQEVLDNNQERLHG